MTGLAVVSASLIMGLTLTSSGSVLIPTDDSLRFLREFSSIRVFKGSDESV
ncbi:hypothetical protein PR003_g17154 [Phytophthora rubi]|uniref:RxLR effector protein n=1 Tax=Phytophthora rubi TaxID=129364 RepID=A0A6A3JWN8_9STRA|nr:hypothetical protein PR002_g18474 [Phytophthora rubi]KAE9030099.1 hypothetical protein PR001_g11341 [Phytophthora rubi]KAE9322718.1 hypothetical protein PR003_g17154 [Phytophthora rubi]